MKRLLIVRHAKSDWADIRLSDFDRPLNKRGQQTAPQMAERLVKKGLVPQYLVSSPALRAKTTANIFAKAFKLAEPNYKQEIYEASASTLLAVVNGLPNAYDYVAMFGHNPGMSDLVNYLTGEFYDMPTCAVALISFDVDAWGEVSGNAGTIEFFDYPKNQED